MVGHVWLVIQGCFEGQYEHHITPLLTLSAEADKIRGIWKLSL